MLGSMKLWVQKILGLEKFGSRKILCLKKVGPQKLGLKSLVKILSVTADILLLKTNVFWT